MQGEKQKELFETKQLSPENQEKDCTITRQSDPLRDFKPTNHKPRIRQQGKGYIVIGRALTQFARILENKPLMGSQDVHEMTKSLEKQRRTSEEHPIKEVSQETS